MILILVGLINILLKRTVYADHRFNRGIASGKSTVAGCSKEGALLLDADLIARKLSNPGKRLSGDRGLAGPSILTSEGCIDRRRLGELVSAIRDQEKE